MSINEIIEFNSSLETKMPEKFQLYLTGISALALGFMKETNATDFKASTTLNKKDGSGKYYAEFIIKEQTND